MTRTRVEAGLNIDSGGETSNLGPSSGAVPFDSSDFSMEVRDSVQGGTCMGTRTARGLAQKDA